MFSSLCFSKRIVTFLNKTQHSKRGQQGYNKFSGIFHSEVFFSPPHLLLFPEGEVLKISFLFEMNQMRQLGETFSSTVSSSFSHPMRQQKQSHPSPTSWFHFHWAGEISTRSTSTNLSSQVKFFYLCNLSHISSCLD